MSLALYSIRDPCPMDEALQALSKAVDEELLTAQRISAAGEEVLDDGGKRRRVVFA